MTRQSSTDWLSVQFTLTIMRGGLAIATLRCRNASKLRDHIRERSSSKEMTTDDVLAGLSTFLAGLFLVCSSGCRTGETPIVLTAEIQSGDYTPIGDDLAPDPELTELIRPYLEEMHAAMDENIGAAEATFERGSPESALGNLVADALLWHARLEFGETVQMSLINNGGIRLPILPQGPITIADIYQLIPFDNRVVVLTLTGDQVASLIRRLAATGGEPIAGFSYRMTHDGSQVSDIRVAGDELVADRSYRIATVDYLASIGGKFEIFQEAAHRQDDTFYLRDAVIRYIRERQKNKPILDGRISYGNEL